MPSFCPKCPSISFTHVPSPHCPLPSCSPLTPLLFKTQNKYNWLCDLPKQRWAFLSLCSLTQSTPLLEHLNHSNVMSSMTHDTNQVLNICYKCWRDTVLLDKLYKHLDYPTKRSVLLRFGLMINFNFLILRYAYIMHWVFRCWQQGEIFRKPTLLTSTKF